MRDPAFSRGGELWGEVPGALSQVSRRQRKEEAMSKTPNTVEEVMTVDVATVEPSEPVEAAIRVMVGRDIGSVVVAEGRRPVGILTERDILRHALDRQDLRGRHVRVVMSAPLFTIELSAEMVEAFDLMNAGGVRQLPVVEGGQLVGIVVERDLLRWVSAVARE
jgi:CBS domain-containing protein